MPKPLSDDLRAAVLDDIRAGFKARNQIARDHGVSQSSVTKIARQAGIGGAFDRTQTDKGTRARQSDNKSKRAQLAADLLDDAQRLRKRAWSAYEVVVSTPEGAETVTLDLPPLPDVRSAYTAIGIAADKSVRLEQVDAEGGEGLAAVDEWLRGMMGQLR